MGEIAMPEDQAATQLAGGLWHEAAQGGTRLPKANRISRVDKELAI